MAWKKVLDDLGLAGVHYEAMKGNFEQNARYISKDRKLTEIGVKPMGNGKKRSLMEFKKQIENGESVLDIAERNFFFSMTKFPDYPSLRGPLRGEFCFVTKLTVTAVP